MDDFPKIDHFISLERVFLCWREFEFVVAKKLFFRQRLNSCTKIVLPQNSLLFLSKKFISRSNSSSSFFFLKSNFSSCVIDFNAFHKKKNNAFWRASHCDWKCVDFLNVCVFDWPKTKSKNSKQKRSPKVDLFLSACRFSCCCWSRYILILKCSHFNLIGTSFQIWIFFSETVNRNVFFFFFFGITI